MRLPRTRFMFLPSVRTRSTRTGYFSALDCGKSVVAVANGRIHGYAHFSASPHCLPAPEILPFAMAPLLKPFGKASAPLMRWFVRWCHLDPDEPHLHLGPIGVAPQAQRQGVGTALMRCYLDHLRAENLPGYLETDKLENIEFYEKFGFVVEHEEEDRKASCRERV